MQKSNSVDWAELISAGYNSGISVCAWCRKHGISKSSFYYHSKKLGFAANGKRILRCDENPAPSPANTDASSESRQELVRIPRQVIQTAMMMQEHSLGTHPMGGVRIRRGQWEILVEDGFLPETLRSVLEEVSYAQGS